MAQVAAWLKSSGAAVSGSDEAVYPPMSEFLAAQGIEVLTPYRPENLDSAATIVIGNAISRGNPEVEAVLEKRLPFLALPELIHKQILAHKLPIVVAGTHGKTTTAVALTQILKAAGLLPGYMIGGLPIGWQSGFEVGQGRWFVIEGDEYDSAFFDKRPKFLHYQPQAVLLNNVEFDHADIYANLDEIYKQFARLIQLIPRSGRLIANGDEPGLADLIKKAPCPVIAFGLKSAAHVRGELLELSPSGMKFKLRLASGQETLCTTSLWGDHQLSNLVGAAAAAEFAGVSPEQIAAGIAEFRGVQRRLELKFSDGNRWLYDDFAHHPTAVKATLASLRTRHPKAVLIAAFEPRSNTMVRSFFQHEIAVALGLADKILIGAVHRQAKIPKKEQLNVQKVVQHLIASGREAQFCDNADILADLLWQDLPEKAALVLMSNGSFSGLCEKLLQRFQTTIKE